MLLAVAWPLFLLWVIGAFEAVPTRLSGAKAFALDLLALGQSMNWSLVPGLYPVVDAQGDSFVFLGAGSWVALVIGLAAWKFSLTARKNFDCMVTPTRERLWSLLAIGTLLYIFGVAFNVRLAGTVLVDLPIPAPLASLYESFRAVGRFGIPLGYLLIAISGLLVTSLAKRHPALWILPLVAVTMQAADLVHAGRLAPSEWQKQEVTIARNSVSAFLSGAG
jgi:hypothetical protein